MTVCYLCHQFKMQNDLVCSTCNKILLSGDLFYQSKGALGIFSIFPYEGLYKKIVRSLKGQNYPELAYKFGQILGEALMPIIQPRTSGVIPIPSKSKIPDHSYFISAGLAQRANLPILDDVLRPTISYPDQKTRNLIERGELSFEIEKTSVDFTKGYWILIDDLVTTGTTLYSAWNSLGRPNAFAATLGFTPRLRGSIESKLKLC